MALQNLYNLHVAGTVRPLIHGYFSFLFEVRRSALTLQEKISTKKALTTFEVAEICDVTPVTIQNWIDKGWLRAYRTPGGHRRVRREELLSFLESRNMPHFLTENVGPPNILIVDDEKDITELIGEVLTSDNPEYDIEMAHDGFRAGVLYANSNPDVVILDLMLPGKSGLELIGDFKGDPVLASIPLVVVTGQGKDTIRDELLTAGASNVFTKPFSPTSLLACIDSLIGR